MTNTLKKICCNCGLVKIKHLDDRSFDLKCPKHKGLRIEWNDFCAEHFVWATPPKECDSKGDVLIKRKEKE